MKKRNLIERMIMLGMLNCNEPAVAVDGSGSDTGGAEAPSSEAPSDSGTDGGIDWGNMFEGSDADHDDAPIAESSDSQPADESPAAAEPAAEPQAAQAETSASEPAPEVVPQATEQPAQEQQPVTEQPAAEPQPVAAQQPQPSAEEQQQAREQTRTSWRDSLVPQYALSEEEASLMATNPGEALPQMAANMHVRIMENTMQFLRQNLPDLVGGQLSQRNANEEASDQFYGAWPELKGKDDLVVQMGKAWRQNNPTGTREEFIKQVGPLVWSAAGMSLQDLVNRGEGESAPPPAPQAAPQPTTTGYSPAPQSPGAAVAPPAGDDNPFAQLASDWKEDD